MSLPDFSTVANVDRAKTAGESRTMLLTATRTYDEVSGFRNQCW